MKRSQLWRRIGNAFEKFSTLGYSATFVDGVSVDLGLCYAIGRLYDEFEFEFFQFNQMNADINFLQPKRDCTYFWPIGPAGSHHRAFAAYLLAAMAESEGD